MELAQDIIKDKVPLIIPKGTSTKEPMVCPVCHEVDVYHISHYRLRSGETQGWKCRSCYRTWKDD